MRFALACALTLAIGVDSAQAQPQPVVETGVDASIRPGDDFFAYANGGWLKATQIPNGSPRWNARNDISELTRRQLEKLIDDTAAAPAGSDARKVADFRAAYLDETMIEARGLTPLAPTFARIEAISDTAELTRFLGSGLRADVAPLNWGTYVSAHLLGLAVEPGLHGEGNYVALLLQGGLGLGDRDLYVSTTPDNQALRTRYEHYIARMLELAGFDHADQRAARALALETAIAQTHAAAEASADEHNAENLWTRVDFVRQAPGLDWGTFFTAAQLSKQESFVVWQPGAIREPPHWSRRNRSTRGATISAFTSSTQMPKYCRAPSPARYWRFMATQRQQFARATRAGSDSAGDERPLGRLYVERHFPAEQKARVQTIATNVIAVFRQRVAAVTWLFPAARNRRSPRCRASTSVWAIRRSGRTTVA